MLRKQVPMKSSRFSLSLKKEGRMGKRGGKEVGEKENKGRRERRMRKEQRRIIRMGDSYLEECSYLSFTWKRRRSHIEGNCR